MQRISSNMQHSDSSYSVRRQESRLHKVNSQLSTQRRIQQLRDDPIAAGHSVRYKSLLARLDRFEKNAKTLNDQYKVAEAPMQSALKYYAAAPRTFRSGCNRHLYCFGS